MEKNIQANLQFVNSYVKDSYIKVHKKPRNNKNNLEMNITVRMSKVNEMKTKTLNANLILIQKIKMFSEESKELLVDLEVSMVGSFIGSNLDKDQFVKMVKYNGAPQLSQLIRSYVITMTSIGGLEPIRIPMINFVEFFKEKQD